MPGLAAASADEQVGRRAGQAVEHRVVRGADGASQVRLRGPPRTALRQAAGRSHQVARGRSASRPGSGMARFYTPATGGHPSPPFPHPNRRGTRAPGEHRHGGVGARPCAPPSCRCRLYLAGGGGGGHGCGRPAARPGVGGGRGRGHARGERAAVRLIGSICPHPRPCSTAPVRGASGDRALLLASPPGRGWIAGRYPLAARCRLKGRSGGAALALP